MINEREDIQNTKAEIALDGSHHRKTASSTQEGYCIDEQEMELNIGFCLLAILLKIVPIVFFFTTTQIKILGFTLVLAAAGIDFWTIKNVIGVRLVNMMWWMKVNLETGEQEWMFLSNQGYTTHHINQAIFWGCIMGGNIFWAVTSLLCLILSSLFWISLCFVCLLLGVLNFLFFMRCRGKHRQKFRELADRVGLASAHSMVTTFE